MELTPDFELIEETKQRMLDLLPDIEKHTRIYLKNKHCVDSNHCGKYHIVKQTGSHIYESSAQTHWVFQTNKYIPNKTPLEYAYKVMVINEKNKIFDTVYPIGEEYASEEKCLEYVLRWQMAKYKFSWIDMTKAHSWLKTTNDQLNNMQLITGDDYGDEIKSKIEAIQKSIRDDLSKSIG